MKNTILGADGVRAMACLMVLGHHFLERLNGEAQTPLVQALYYFGLKGEAGVSVFFVLSGMLLSIPFWRNFAARGPLPDLREFARRRAVRILPGYYASLILSFGIGYLLWHPDQLVWERLFAGLTLTSGLHYLTYFPTEINGPLWSISFEVFCYLLMPLMMVLMFWQIPRRGLGVAYLYWLGALVLVLGLNQVLVEYFQPDGYRRGWEYGLLGGAKEWFPHYSLLGMFAHYIFGVFSAGLIVGLEHNPALAERLKKLWFFDGVALLSLLGLTAVLWQVRLEPEFSHSWQAQPYFFPYATLPVMLLLAALPFSNLLGRLFDNPFARYTAKVSFGIYIWHMLIIELYRDRLNLDFKWSGINGLGEWLLICAVLTAVIFAVAALSYKFIEEPALSWYQNRKKKPALKTQASR